MKPTLEQLQEFTDAELSEAIFIKVYGKVKVLHAYSSVAIDHIMSFDINNWSDMGALANKHKIGSVYSSISGNCCAFTIDDEIECWHQNELRAKAIVFLLMDI